MFNFTEPTALSYTERKHLLGRKNEAQNFSDKNRHGALATKVYNDR